MKNAMFLILSAIFLSGLFTACGEDGKTGKDGSSCTIVENEDGTEKLVCDDGTEVEIVSGEKGDKGDQGDQGDQGAPGQDGANGDPGADGEDGAQALVITTELSSDPEDDNYDENCPYGGVKIESGIDDGEGNFVDAPVVTYVCNGKDGETGEKGETGETGETGQTGETGETGEDGADGADGADGVCAENNPPVINSITVNDSEYTGEAVSTILSMPFSVIINAVDADLDTLNYSISGGYADITDNGNGNYSFTVDTEGVFNFSVIVSDGCQMAVKNFAVNVIHIIYSGANRNIVYSKYQYNDTISLFNAAGTWDDMVLDLQIFEEPSYMIQYSFGNLLNVHGNYVEFAVGSYFFDIKKFSYGEEIGSSLTYSGNNYKDFSSYYNDVENNFINENGEFSNTTGYAGLKFTDGTNIYYGWIQVSVTNYNNSNMTGTLIDWAYNSIPGEPIPAGYTGE